MLRRSRPGRPSWILAAALFGAGVLVFGPLTDGPELLSDHPIQAAGVFAGGGVVREAVAAPRDGAGLPATNDVRSRAPLVDSPPDSVRPLAPHALRGYRWPLRRGRLTLGFQHSGWGSRLVDGERFHDGIDLATSCGDRIVAAHSGVVLAAGRRFDDHVGWIGDLGPYYERLTRKKLWDVLPIVVVIDDENGYRSIYAHFERVVVKKGERVEAGQLIGYEGQTGRASGCHLHYGLFSPLETARFRLHPTMVKALKVPRWQVARVDPLLVLPPRPGDPPPTVLASTDPTR